MQRAMGKRREEAIEELETLVDDVEDFSDSDIDQKVCFQR